MIDYGTIKRYALNVSISYAYFDRAWVAVVTADGCPTLNAADQDPNAAISTALSRFMLECHPHEVGAA